MAQPTQFSPCTNRANSILEQNPNPQKHPLEQSLHTREEHLNPSHKYWVHSSTSSEASEISSPVSEVSGSRLGLEYVELQLTLSVSSTSVDQVGILPSVEQRLLDSRLQDVRCSVLPHQWTCNPDLQQSLDLTHHPLHWHLVTGLKKYIHHLTLRSMRDVQLNPAASFEYSILTGNPRLSHLDHICQTLHANLLTSSLTVHEMSSWHQCLCLMYPSLMYPSQYRYLQYRYSVSVSDVSTTTSL